MKTKADIFVDEYLPQRELYRDFGVAIKGILTQLLLDTDIKIHLATTREKDPRKIPEKISRKEREGTKYKKLTDIEDLAGVRIVTSLESQKNKVVELVYKEFEASNPKVEPKDKRKGYRGTHLVLSLTPDRAKLPEYSRYKDLKCEVQITSALYNTWSEIEHDVIYKPGPDTDKLKSLGLDQLEDSFEKVMSDHIEQAAIQFDYIDQKHKDILKAGALFFSDYAKDLKKYRTNEEIISVLDLADKFSHKKTPDCIQMVSIVAARKPIPPKLVAEYGTTKIYGKENSNVIQKCLDILGHYHVRYSDVPKVLSLVFDLSKHEEPAVAGRALKVLEELVAYNTNFLEACKTIYPQLEAMNFLKKIPTSQRHKNIAFISAALTEILSTQTEANFWSRGDQLTHRTGALNGHENLARLRKDAVEYTTDLIKKSRDPKIRFALIKILTSALHTPINSIAPDSLINQLVAESKTIVEIFRDLVLRGKRIKNYSLAIEVEQELSRLIQSQYFNAPHIKELYDDLQKDEEYAIFCTLVGDIRKYKNPDEDWHIAESRRTEDIAKLVEDTSLENLDVWQGRFEKFTDPFKKGVLDEWQYASLQNYIVILATKKATVAFKLFEHALKKNTPLASLTFLSTFLSALRNTNQRTVWDKFVTKLNSKRIPELLPAIVYSLNLNNGVPLSYIRKKDLKTISDIASNKNPFNYGKKDDFRLRHSLIGTLSHLHALSPLSFEKLIISEIAAHPKAMHVYFNELPFASHRGWMKLSDWSKKGKNFIADQLVQIKSLDWHNQEMLHEMHKDSLGSVLDVFRRRILKEEKRRRDDDYYDAIPYDFNPQLREFMAGHSEYAAEMSKWVAAMTPKWSKYNWEVSHFIKNIGGPSYTTILRTLIDKGDTQSLKKATYALEGLESPDVSICMEIAGLTDNKEIINKLHSVLFSTGVVMGEDGLARAMEGKAKMMEPYLKSTNPRTKKFAKEMKEYFERRANVEFREAAERKKRMDLEFEG